MYEQIKSRSAGNRIKTPEPGRTRSEGESRRTRDDTMHYVATKTVLNGVQAGSKFDAVAVCLFPPPVRRRFLFSFCCSPPRLQRHRTARSHTRSRLPPASRRQSSRARAQRRAAPAPTTGRIGRATTSTRRSPRYQHGDGTGNDYTAELARIASSGPADPASATGRSARSRTAG